MSLAALLQNAAAFAQSQLAQMQGMEPSAVGNTLLNGATVTGVYGKPEVREEPGPRGGTRRLSDVSLTITRAQLDAAPKSQTDLVRIDLTPRITYRIASVDTNDPLHYVLTLSKVGE